MAKDAEKAHIFAEYTAQMQRVDAQAQIRLSSLKVALRLTAELDQAPATSPPPPVDSSAS